MGRVQNTERRKAARALVLSSGRLPDGSLLGLARRIDQLSRLLSPVDDEGWSPVEQPRDHSHQIRALLEAATRLVAARRYVAARDAYERAEELYQVNAPTIRQKRLIARAQVGAKNAASLIEARRRIQDNKAQRRQKALAIREQLQDKKSGRYDPRAFDRRKLPRLVLAALAQQGIKVDLDTVRRYLGTKK